MRIERHGSGLLRPLLITMAAVAVLSLGVAGYLYLTRPINPVPADISTQLGFSPFTIPLGLPDYTTERYQLTTTEDGTKVLSYIVHAPDGSQITVSEYTQPAQFTDVPEYKDRFLSNVAKMYDTVPTATGTVYLGRLAKQNDEQVGVMIERGLLVFLKPNHDLDAVQWRKMVETLEILKT